MGEFSASCTKLLVPCQLIPQSESGEVDESHMTRGVTLAAEEMVEPTNRQASQFNFP